MIIEMFSHEGPGIQEVYKNDKWLVAIKNWREANDVESIARLEIHFKTDEQFILLSGKAVLIYAETPESEVEAIALEPGKVFSVPKGLWYNNVLSRDARLVYIEDSDTRLAPDNSIYRNLSPEQIISAKKKVSELLGL